MTVHVAAAKAARQGSRKPNRSSHPRCSAVVTRPRMIASAMKIEAIKGRCGRLSQLIPSRLKIVAYADFQQSRPILKSGVEINVLTYRCVQVQVLRKTFAAFRFRVFCSTHPFASSNLQFIVLKQVSKLTGYRKMIRIW
jgi:hypothetical protein